MSFINSILKAFVGDKSEKDVKATQPYIAKIKALESTLIALSHDELRAKTTQFKTKIKDARAKQDAEIASKRLEAENTSDIDLREDIYNAIDALEQRLNIMVPNPELEKEWDELKELGDRYRALEKQCKEKGEMWAKLKEIKT